MPKYALFVTYTSDAWDAMVEKPRDRAAQARAVVEAADGTMESITSRRHSCTSNKMA